MKKLFALMLALCLMLCSAALADDMVWEGAVAELASQFEGEFVTFDDIAVKIWIPAEFKAVELTDEDKQNGYIGYFAKDEQTAIAVVYANVEGMSLEDYQANVAELDGVSEIEPGTVNDLPCLSYKSNGNGSLAFATQMGYILEITYGPLEGNDVPTEVACAFASIQAAE